MTTEEQPIFICSRTSRLSESEVVPGSKHGVCMECGAAIWVAPATQRRAATGIKYICGDCAPRDVAVHVMSDTVKEFSEILGRPVDMAEIAELVARWRQGKRREN